MKHILNKIILAMVAATVLLCSCTKKLPNEGFGEDSYLSLNIDGQQTPSVEASATTATSASAARQGASTRAVAVDESVVNNLWILQFDMSTAAGKLVKKTYIDAPTDLADLKKIKYSPKAGTNMALYLVANVGSTLFNPTADGTTLATVKATMVNVTPTTGSNFPTPNSTNLPMVGLSATTLKLPTSTAVKITLTRTVAKVILTVKNLLETGYPKLTVTSTQLKNVPKIYSTQVIDMNNGFTGTTYYPPASTTNDYFTDYTAVTGNIAAAGTTYYLAPNVRGTTTTNRTYVEILGKAMATASSPEVDVRYRLYLSNLYTNDCNIYSNTAYKVNIELAGLFATDASLTITTDKFDLAQGDSDADHSGDIVGWEQVFIGDVKEDAVVYWVDPTNPLRYKLISKYNDWEPWSAYPYHTVGSAAQDMDNGKANVAAIRQYSIDNNLNEGIEYFPSVADCYKMGEGWYLPAINEFLEFYNAYKENKEVIDNAFIIDLQEFKEQGFENKVFWSSTEHNIVASKAAMAFSFKENKVEVREKKYVAHSRCIKVVN